MKFKKTVLNNGLRIVTVPMTGSETAMAMVLVEAGSDYEDKKINGLSHFLEHMCFKGTENRTNRDIGIELDTLGASYNAFTGNEVTGYFAKARYTKLPKILDIVSDVYLNSIFPEKDIDIERGVIIEEINMYEDMPVRKIWDVWMELLYPEQSVGRTIIGPKENIRKFTREDFVNYQKKHYIPQKTVVVVAGNFEEKEVVKQIKNTFGNLKKDKIIEKPKLIDKQKTPQVKTFYKKTDQSHLIMGFKAFPLHDDRNYVLALASNILGKGFSSRLFKIMRDELGLCYYVKSYNDTTTNHGEFVVSAGVGNDKLELSIETIVGQFKKLRDEKVTEEELKKAKESHLGNLATGLETSDAWADYYGEQELHHEKMMTPKDVAKKIKSITAEDIQKVMKQVIKKEKMNLAIVGPQKDAKKFEKFLKI